MKRMVLGLALALCSLTLPLEADAGGVVIHGRWHQQVVQPDRDLSRLQMPGQKVSEFVASASGGPGGQGSLEGGSQGTPGKPKPPPVLPLPLDPQEVEQIQAGLITYEEATSGCSATGGASGLLPMLVVGGALLRRRRR